MALARDDPKIFQTSPSSETTAYPWYNEREVDGLKYSNKTFYSPIETSISHKIKTHDLCAYGCDLIYPYMTQSNTKSHPLNPFGSL